MPGPRALRIPYSFPNTAVSDRWIGVYVDGVLASQTNSTNGPRLDQPSGTHEVALDLTCWATGTHVVKVVGDACVHDHNGEAPASQRSVVSFPLDVNSKPTVALSQSEAANGDDTLTVSYNFPNTGARYVQVFVDGGWVGSTYPAQASGSLTVSLGQRCWQKAIAVADACGRTDEGSRAEAEIENTTDWPLVQLALKKLGIDSATGRRVIEARVQYDFRDPVAGRSLRLDVLPWVGQNGQLHPGYPLASRGANDPLNDTWVFTFVAPSDAQQVLVRATAAGCGIATSDDAVDCPPCDDAASADPVYFTDGNMRLTDTDPLPPIAGHTLNRAYNSDEQVSGLFGRGFTTLFDRRLMSTTIDGKRLVWLTTDTNEVVMFEAAGGSFRQTWPVRADSGTLSEDSAAGTFSYRPAGGTGIAVFSASTGRLIALREAGTGHEARITYAADGLPQTFTDSWTGATWTFTGNQRRVTSMAMSGEPGLVWTYNHDAAGNLTTVDAPGASRWRTYEYAANRMTASRDASGNLIESHSYDANGFAIDSTGPGDEIESIEYNLPGSIAEETIARVTQKTGAVTRYVMRPSGGAYRTVQVIGGCSNCGGGVGDRTYVRDQNGRIVRHQTADGFVTVTEYARGHAISQQRYLKPAGCDPATDANRCRMTTGELASAMLEPTAATSTTEYAYTNASWPDRPTIIYTASVAVAGSRKRENVSYHPSSGAILMRTMTGFAGADRAFVSHRTVTTLYEPGAVAAFDPGGGFQSAWLALPQPALLTKSIDGPRAVADVSSFVYYPIHDSVPPRLRGRLAATRNAAGHVTRFDDYDVFGNVTRSVDPNGVATEMAYDHLGRLKTSIVKGIPGCAPADDALCSIDLTTTRAYSPAAGPLRSEQSPGGGVKVYEYDDRGRVLTLSRGPTAFDLRERIETGYDPLTGRKSLERTLSFENGAWVEKRRQSFTHDVLGQLRAVVHADGARVEYTYDAAGRLATVQDENHSERNTTYAYDSAGRLELVRQKLLTATDGWITTRYAYDRDGNLVSVTDPNGNVAAYAYDDFGLMVEQQSPVTGWTRYDYDEAGNLIQATDANGVATERTYDLLGRVIAATSRAAQAASLPSTTSPRAELVTWVYDDPSPDRFAVGRLSSMTDPSGTTVYDYERRGLLTEEWRTFDGCFATRQSGTACDQVFQSGAFITRYRYDRDGNRTEVVYPSNDLSVLYTFDYAGRPLSASGTVTAAQYLPFGPLSRLTFANGTTQTLAYDSRYRLRENALTTPAATLARYVYRYDAAGNVIAIDDDVDASYSRGFGYDDLNRLVTANTGRALWQNGSYTWDAMGNPLMVKLGEVQPGPSDGLLRTGPRIRPDAETRTGGRILVFSYADTTPRIARVANDIYIAPPSGGGELLRSGPRIVADDTATGTAVTYDAAGNETGYLATRTYSPRNLLLEVGRQRDDPQDPVTHTVKYAYDGRGIRVVRGETPGEGFTTSATRYFFYTPELKLLSETADNDETRQRHEIIWFGDRPVAQISSHGTRRYTFTDHLGTPLLQTDATATVTWQAEYEPFGNIYDIRAGSRGDQPLRFPGQESAMNWEGQEENYNVFRWYRSGWGRYSSADPIGLQGGLNLYRYANANPINAIDPTGLAVRVICRRVDVGRGLLPWLVGAWLQPVHCRLQVECPCSDGQGDPRAPFNRTIGMEATGGGYQLNTDQFLAPRWGGPFQDYERGWFNVPVTPPGGSGGCDFERCLLREARARENTSPQTFMRPYAIAGPNSNSYIRNLVDTCGGSAQWPQNAYGADPNPFWGGNYRP